MVTTAKPKEKSVIEEPKFIDPKNLTEEQLTDPDYHLKQLVKLSGGKFSITCSKCHHCRYRDEL